MGHFYMSLALVAVLFLVSRRITASSMDSWLWMQDSYLDDKQLNSYYLSEGTFTSVSECAMECMQITECLSFFFMELSTNEKHCKFHAKIFSTWEVDNFGLSVPGSRNFKITSDCPEDVQYHFSKWAKMCIQVNIGTANFATASTNCIGNGNSLVVIDTSEKQQFVMNVLQSTSGFSSRGYFVGASSNMPGEYIWANGELVSSGFLHSKDTLTNSCIYVKLNASSEVQGHSSGCTEIHSYICERVLAV